MDTSLPHMHSALKMSSKSVHNLQRYFAHGDWTDKTGVKMVKFQMCDTTKSTTLKNEKSHILAVHKCNKTILHKYHDSMHYKKPMTV